jgi:hypothetical protein
MFTNEIISLQAAVATCFLIAAGNQLLVMLYYTTQVGPLA